jgi:hypothetical protein
VTQLLSEFAATPRLEPYVHRERLSRLPGAAGTGEFWMRTRALALNFWLQQLEPVTNHAGKECEYVSL